MVNSTLHVRCRENDGERMDPLSQLVLEKLASMVVDSFLTWRELGLGMRDTFVLVWKKMGKGSLFNHMHHLVSQTLNVGFVENAHQGNIQPNDMKEFHMALFFQKVGLIFFHLATAMHLIPDHLESPAHHHTHHLPSVCQPLPGLN